MDDVSTILNYIENGHIALPTFQRGYVWNRNQVRGLFDSLYKRHPIGGLLVWVTESSGVTHRGDGPLSSGTVNLLLDGQQRITSLYGVIRGEPPKFFDGNEQIFKNLRFHLDNEVFEFYQPVKMRDDPLWVDVTDLMKKGIDGIGDFVPPSTASDAESGASNSHFGRLARLVGIATIKIPAEKVTGDDKTLDVITDIFNRINSGGTKLSKGDLALAKICAEWPEGRKEMKKKLAKWNEAGYDNFDLDWLLRSVNTLLTGEARFQHLHGKSATEVREALEQAAGHIDQILEMIAGRLGLDHARVFFGPGSVPVMVRYLAQREDKNLKPMDEKERDKLLFWYVQSAMWGRYSGSTETVADQDLAAIGGDSGSLDALLKRLIHWRGSLTARPGDFAGWNRGARFYPILYLLSRMHGARDWGTGLPLKKGMLGKKSRLERHHIFPRAQLNKLNYQTKEVNALANFCFLTKGTNLSIGSRLPEEYFPEIEEAHPGALESQWIPMNRDLWKIRNFEGFLEARRALLARALNAQMQDLLHGDLRWLSDGVSTAMPESPQSGEDARDRQEESEISEINDWMVAKGLPKGALDFDCSDPDTGQQKAVFDLAWPNGIQEGLSHPVAVLLNEDAETMAVANQSGFLGFTSAADFKRYVATEILDGGEISQG
ncbi:MAG: DUF262 domain-containing protein [Alphaproteobacteria bacterium]|nr:DUF262 domain-containing protein [Alphaproteobacteria bacterium]